MVAPVVDLNGAAAGTGATLGYTENAAATAIAPAGASLSSSQIVVPPSALPNPPAGTYVFGLQVTNFLNYTSAIVYQTVLVSGTPRCSMG